MKSKKKLIITADDFGICKEINRGIVEAHTNGFLKSTALLINAPETNHALDLLKSNPKLEVGLHLAVVESYLTNTSTRTLSEKLNYFPDKECLHRDWKAFCLRSFLGRVNYNELYEELKMQVELFLSKFDNIPFINVTQHLQMLPSISRILAKLMEDYPILGLRLFNFNGFSSLVFNKKLHLTLLLQLMGVLARKKINSSIVVPDQIQGIEFSGNINFNNFKKLLRKVNADICEIVMHPGYNSSFLREQLPNSYASYKWEDELKVLCNNEIYDFIRNSGFEIAKFGEI